MWLEASLGSRIRVSGDAVDLGTARTRATTLCFNVEKSSQYHIHTIPFTVVTGSRSPSPRDPRDNGLAIPTYHCHRSLRHQFISCFEETPPKLQIHYICADTEGNSKSRRRWVPSGSGRTARLWTRGRTDLHLIGLGIQIWANMTEDQNNSKAEEEDRVAEVREDKEEGEDEGMRLERTPTCSRYPPEPRRHRVQCHLQLLDLPAQPKRPLQEPKYLVRLHDRSLHLSITHSLPLNEYHPGK